MTTPEAEPSATTSGAARKRRSPPKRIGPVRNKAATAKADAGQTPGLDVAVTDAVAQAVRLGYQVLSQNLEEGRAAAAQFRVGEYSARDVPADLNQLAQRMVRLARDLSATTFDLMDRVLQDPQLTAAIRRVAEPPAGATLARVVAPAKAPAAKTPAAKTPAATVPAKAPSSAAPPTPFVPLTCQFTGLGKAAVLASWLARPPTPTTLATAGLATLTTGAATIVGLSFQPSADGFGVVATIPIPANQAAGIYSGAVVSAESGVALGTLTIQVGA